jgi:hypothetical protein
MHNWPSSTCTTVFATKNPILIHHISTHTGHSWMSSRSKPSSNSMRASQLTSFGSIYFSCPSMAFNSSSRSTVCVSRVLGTPSTNSTRKPSGQSLPHFCPQQGMKSRLMSPSHEPTRMAIGFYGFLGQLFKVWTRMRSVPEPRWLINDTVFSWAQRIQLYDILCRLCGQSLDKKDISLNFLQGVQGKHISLAQAMSYQLDKLAVDDDTISSEWMVDTMSLTLNSTVTGDLVDEMQLRPRLQRNRPAGPRNRPPAPGPRVHFLSTDPDTADDDEEDDFYSSTASATSQSSINNTSLQRSNTQHQQRGPPNVSSNQQRLSPQHDGNCGACGRYGHKETHCDHLAIWANLQRYLKMATPTTLQQAEAEWMKKNKRFLGGSTLTPSKVAANFIAAHNVDIDHIFTTLDWDTWSEDTGFTLLDDSE